MIGLFLPNFKQYNSKHCRNKSKFVLLADLPFMALVNGLVFGAGSFVCFFFFYGCDPFLSKEITNKNQIGVYWIHSILGKNVPILSGIFLSSLLFYSLVQHSYGMSLCATTLLREVIGIENNVFTQKFTIIIKRCLITFLSVTSISYSIYFQNVKDTMLSMCFFFNNAINSPLLGLFLVSALNPLANHFGAITAFTCNVLFNLCLGLSRLNSDIYEPKEFKRTTLLCPSGHHHYHTHNRTYRINYHNNREYFNRQYELLRAELSDKVFEYNNLTQSTTMAPSAMFNETTSPYDLFLSTIFSISPSWYCLFSVLFTFIFGSILSVLYSIVIEGRLDIDADHAEERKKYLYYYRFKSFFLSKV
jgi:hypothetical protein